MPFDQDLEIGVLLECRRDGMPIFTDFSLAEVGASQRFGQEQRAEEAMTVQSGVRSVLREREG